MASSTTTPSGSSSSRPGFIQMGRIILIPLLLGVLSCILSSCATNTVGPALTNQEFTSGGLGGPTAPTFWNSPIAPEVGQIFKREQGQDGSVWFSPFYDGMATEVKARAYTGWNASGNYSHTTEKGPNLDVTLAYMGASASVKGEYIKAITVSAKDTSIQYVNSPLGLQYNILNDKSVYPTYVNLIVKDSENLRNSRLPPSAATYWMVTTILYSKDFDFEIKRTVDGTGTIGTGTSGKLAQLITAGAIPSGNVTVGGKDNSDSSLSGKLDKPFPIFVRIVPIVADSSGDLSLANSSLVPPFEESLR